MAESKRRCPTCDIPQVADAFYANCAECKSCKRARSKHNRMVQARKLAAFERLVDALAARYTEPPELRTEISSVSA